MRESDSFTLCRGLVFARPLRLRTKNQCWICSDAYIGCQSRGALYMVENEDVRSVGAELILHKSEM